MQDIEIFVMCYVHLYCTHWCCHNLFLSFLCSKAFQCYSPRFHQTPLDFPSFPSLHCHTQLHTSPHFPRLFCSYLAYSACSLISTISTHSFVSFSVISVVSSIQIGDLLLRPCHLYLPACLMVLWGLHCTFVNNSLICTSSASIVCIWVLFLLFIPVMRNIMWNMWHTWHY